MNTSISLTGPPRRKRIGEAGSGTVASRGRRTASRTRADRGTCDQRGADQRALLDQKATSIQLALQFGEQVLDQSVLRQTLPKPPDRAVVRRLVLQRQPGKTLET